MLRSVWALFAVLLPAAIGSDDSTLTSSSGLTQPTELLEASECSDRRETVDLADVDLKQYQFEEVESDVRLQSAWAGVFAVESPAPSGESSRADLWLSVRLDNTAVNDDSSPSYVSLQVNGRTFANFRFDQVDDAVTVRSANVVDGPTTSTVDAIGGSWLYSNHLPFGSLVLGDNVLSLVVENYEVNRGWIQEVSVDSSSLLTTWSANPTVLSLGVESASLKVAVGKSVTLEIILRADSNCIMSDIVLSAAATGTVVKIEPKLPLELESFQGSYVARFRLSAEEIGETLVQFEASASEQQQVTGKVIVRVVQGAEPSQTPYLLFGAGLILLGGFIWLSPWRKGR